MIMNSRGDGLWPAHQDQVELGVTLMHKVPGVLVLVPLCELLEVIWIKLVSMIINYFYFINFMGSINLIENILCRLSQGFK